MAPLAVLAGLFCDGSGGLLEQRGQGAGSNLLWSAIGR